MLRTANKSPNRRLRLAVHVLEVKVSELRVVAACLLKHVAAMLDGTQQLPGQLLLLHSFLLNSEQIIMYGTRLSAVQCKLHGMLLEIRAALCNALLLRSKFSCQLPGNTCLHALIDLIRQDWQSHFTRVAGCRVDATGLH